MAVARYESSSMELERLNRVISLRDNGQVEDALEQFRAMREDAQTDEDRALLLGNEATCLTLLDKLSEARAAADLACGLLSPSSRHWPYMNFLLGSLAFDEGKL